MMTSDDQIRRAVHFGVWQIERVAEYASDMNVKDGVTGLGSIYFVPSILKTTSSGRRAKDRDFVASSVFWADCDTPEQKVSGGARRMHRVR